MNLFGKGAYHPGKHAELVGAKKLIGEIKLPVKEA